MFAMGLIGLFYLYCCFELSQPIAQNLFHRKRNVVLCQDISFDQSHRMEDVNTRTHTHK